MAAEVGKARKQASGIRPYARAGENEAPTPGVAMPRAPRLYAPEGTVHVVARCNNREFHFTIPDELARRRPVPFPALPQVRLPAP